MHGREAESIVLWDFWAGAHPSSILPPLLFYVSGSGNWHLLEVQRERERIDISV